MKCWILFSSNDVIPRLWRRLTNIGVYIYSLKIFTKKYNTDFIMLITLSPKQ